MITKTQAFKTEDGQTWLTLAQAQRVELIKLITAKNSVEKEIANRVLDGLFENLEAVKDILRCTGRRPRKAKGNGKPRTRRVTAEKVETATV